MFSFLTNKYMGFFHADMAKFNVGLELTQIYTGLLIPIRAAVLVFSAK